MSKQHCSVLLKQDGLPHPHPCAWCNLGPCAYCSERPPATDTSQPPKLFEKSFEDSLYDEPLPGSFMAKFTPKQREAINAMTNKSIVEASRKPDDAPPAAMGPCKEVEMGGMDQASVIRLEYELELARLREENRKMKDELIAIRVGNAFADKMDAAG